MDPQFLTCNRYLDNFETITIQGAEDFCNSDCASTLMNAARVCGLEVSGKGVSPPYIYDC